LKNSYEVGFLSNDCVEEAIPQLGNEGLRRGERKGGEHEESGCQDQEKVWEGEGGGGGGKEGCRERGKEV